MKYTGRGCARIAAATAWLFASWMAGIAAAQTTTVAGSTPGQFSVNESGAATHRIPIQVPPGVAGMEPKLELAYNSQGGNGLLGIGWSLSGISVISRCPRTMAQDGVRGGVKFDMNDRYCMDGQRLILVSGTYGVAGSEYRTELDSFSKIVASGTAGSGVASFTVQTKAGLTMEYGNTADSRVEAQGKTSVRIWALNKITDVKTNFMTFSYYESADSSIHALTTINYGGNAAAAAPANSSVVFEYDTARLDKSQSYIQGSQIQLDRRMTAIKAYSGASLVKTYTLAYAYGAATRKSHVNSLTECSAVSGCLAPIQLTWADSSAAPGIFSSQQTGVIVPGNWGAVGSYQKYRADLNGDGTTDLVAIHIGTDGVWAYTWLGQGDGTLGSMTNVIAIPDNWGTVGSYQAQVVDINGDGIPDITAVQVGPVGVWAYAWLGKGDGTFFPKVDAVSVSGNWGSIGDYKSEIVDMNGDGIADLTAVYIGPAGVYGYTWLGKGDGTFLPMTSSVAVSGNWGTVGNYQKQILDIDGDGIPDLTAVLIGPDGVYAYTWLGKGDGTFLATNSAVTISGNWGAVGSYRSQFIDVNGDGIPDLTAVQIGPVGVWAYTWIGKGDGSFLPIVTAATVDGNWGSIGNYQAQLADVNGDGIADLTAVNLGPSGAFAYTWMGKGDGTFLPWTAALNGYGNWGTVGNYKSEFVDINADGIPDITATYVGPDGVYAYFWTNTQTSTYDQLLTIDQAGKRTTVTYSPLTKAAVYTKDSTPAAAVFPKIDLIFPQYVVNTVASSNGIGGTVTTQYNYGGLKAEQGTGRGMLGFRWMKSKNLTNNIESYTEFNQNWPLTGSVARSETRLAGSGNAGVLKRTTNTYAQGTGSATGTTFAYPSQSVEESWDLGGSAYPTVTNAYQYGQSPQYGDPTQISVTNSASAGKTTVNEYWPANTGSGSWVLGRLKKATVTSVAP
ncbi:Repeat domain-containing protein [Polaromonas sp. YR568]|uniref:FG-GAP-like repeat-containing protein n=1 Tax=Polaromonas sp. YR568 TaxID=1855301 RepID=UPI0008EC65A6|nr:FG-GAP-like repeat-containing protein [Polaromonas sp. YR568]SFU59186.1 Repeat domain-containing protein [Polaromonas sp. YR568]